MDNKYRILIIANSLSIRMTSKESFAQMGFSCDVTVTATEAWEILKSSFVSGNTYHGLVIELMLPGNSFIDLYESISKNKHLSDISIIFLAEAGDKKIKHLEKIIDPEKHKCLFQAVEDIDMIPGQMLNLIKNNINSALIKQSLKNISFQYNNGLGYKILIVDDSITSRMSCEEILTQKGFNCKSLATAEEAWKELEISHKNNQIYNGMVLDWVLPGMSGRELMVKIIEDERFNSLAIMIFTQQPDNDVWKLALKRKNCDIQFKEEIQLLPLRMLKFINVYCSDHYSSQPFTSFKKAKESLKETILIVDDSITVREKCSNILNEAGYEVIEVSSMKEALELTSHTIPDLAIIDYFMPEGNGDELCEKLRENPETKDIPVIMYSQRKDIMEQALKVGAMDLVYKDDPLHIFLMRIEAIMGLIRSQRNIRQLDILSMATESLEVGVMLKKEGPLTAFNNVMRKFANECDGLKIFDIPNSVCFNTIDNNDTNRYFKINTLKISNTEEAKLVQDITEQQMVQKKLNKLARHDPLTGLPNRYLFYDYLPRITKRALRQEQLLAVLIIDLDRFKQVNDILGHSAGDELLKQTAKRMNDCIRDVDLLARVGGDEFYMILDDVESPEAVTIVARRLINALSEPFNLDGNEARIGCSIGISIFPSDNKNPDVLLQQADTAMYRVKEEGRNGYRFYTRELDREMRKKVLLTNEIHEAMDQKQFKLFYQPQVSVRTGKIVGMEALLRWQHPQRGTISPAIFIPILEKSRLISEIGSWVLKEACTQNKIWKEKGFRSLTMAVNFSPKQFYENDLAENVKTILKETEMDPSLLDIEITEGVFMEDSPHVLNMLDELKTYGVGMITMDDFGTGYSSLSYLKRFPIDVVKIDKIFVQGSITDQSDATLISAIIAMAQGLNLKGIVAEGVEDERQLQLLKEKGCSTYQGYYFSRPRPAIELEELLVSFT